MLKKIFISSILLIVAINLGSQDLSALKKRIAVMIGLIVRFIPVILHLTREVSDAQRARAIEQRRNPIYRASHLALPIMRRTLGRAELLADAMESRCFNENRPTPSLYAAAIDWRAMAAVLVVCLCLLVG